MANKNYFNESAQKKLIEGITTLTNAVATTLGPRGRNVAIDRGYDVVVLHDGVNVAKNVDLKDKGTNVGVRLLREAAQNQVDKHGDGTTLVTILAEAIVKEAYKLIATGINPMSLRKGLEGGAALLVSQLDRISTPIDTLEEKIQIATISAEDPDLGKMIGETLDKIGTDGVITVEESKSAETIMEHQEGMMFDKGFISPHFLTDPLRGEATVEDCFVWISNENLTNIPELLPFWGKIGEKSKNLVIIAPDITDSALASFIVTKKNGGMNILCVAAPLFGDKQKAFLDDIAILTGGKVITKESGVTYDKLELDVLGQAGRVTSTKDSTVIVGGKGEPQAIQDRVESLRKALEEEEAPFEIEKYKERIAKLTGGVSVIKVGGHTEAEMKERKERADDSVHATKAAIDDGVVPGGEITLMNIRKILPLDNLDPALTIWGNALERPFRKLMENSGFSADLKLNELVGQDTNFGIDATDGVAKDMIKAGIIDPTLVLKGAIQHAVSTAIQILTTDLVIVPEDEPKKV